MSRGADCCYPYFPPSHSSSVFFHFTSLFFFVFVYIYIFFFCLLYPARLFCMLNASLFRSYFKLSSVFSLQSWNLFLLSYSSVCKLGCVYSFFYSAIFLLLCNYCLSRFYFYYYLNFARFTILNLTEYEMILKINIS